MKQMKKLLAFVLAFAMIITIYQPSAAYAATKKIRLNAKTMTLQVGQKKTLKVKNAGKKAKLKWSSKYESNIYIEVDDKRINAKSIMGMMSLGLCAGEELTVAAEGADEQTAVDNIEKFLSGQVA